jgi:hypothetical protein
LFKKNLKFKKEHPLPFPGVPFWHFSFLGAPWEWQANRKMVSFHHASMSAGFYCLRHSA